MSQGSRKSRDSRRYIVDSKKNETNIFTLEPQEDDAPQSKLNSQNSSSNYTIKINEENSEGTKVQTQNPASGLSPEKNWQGESEKTHEQSTKFDIYPNTDRSTESNRNMNSTNGHLESRTVGDGIESEIEIRLNTQGSEISLSSTQQVHGFDDMASRQKDAFFQSDYDDTYALGKNTETQPKKRFSGPQNVQSSDSLKKFAKRVSEASPLIIREETIEFDTL